MPKVIDKGDGGASKSCYLDGETWLLERGVDFSHFADPKLIARKVRGEAAVYGLDVTIEIRSDGNILVDNARPMR